ncbi:uncharacterized protein LOC117176685, partial [Belonocnema kinseyi]|uniref:uncharacterized protein LOC117176685 n=1 Tax=Belonocnema kinseyi TaxID=2817044 RepID=UPI00143DA5AC
FEFVQNSLYYLLQDTIEGLVILGIYKHSIILLESRLKYLIIQKLIVENALTYRITKKRFEEVVVELKELFPTIKSDNWYSRNRSNARGQAVTFSGSLLNYYKVYRKNLPAAHITDSSPALENIQTSFVTITDTNRHLNLKPMTDENRSSYDIGIILSTWKDSFETKFKNLVKHQNKKVFIKYETYLNTYVCLNCSFGLELLETDSYTIIQNLAKEKRIPTTVEDNFRTILGTRWPVLAELIFKHGDNSHNTSIKEFKHKHNNISNVPKTILALFYAAYTFTKTTTITTKKEGKFNFPRDQCVEHFIKLLQNETDVIDYKVQHKKILNNVGLDAAPYFIFCGDLNNITKSFFVVDVHLYDGKDPLQAVENCLKASLALHCWTTTCVNVWLYLLEHVYSIRPYLSCAFLPSKSAKTVSNYITKIDPSFTTLTRLKDIVSTDTVASTTTVVSTNMPAPA